MNTILVPHDFSDCSVAAADKAAELSDKLGAKMVLLHIRHYEVVAQEVATGETNFNLLESDRKKLDAEVARLSAAFPKLELEDRVAFGTPVEMILEEAKVDHAEMIVMGTHGRRGLSHLVLGSVAEKVVQLASIPVLVCKATGEEVKKVAANGG